MNEQQKDNNEIGFTKEAPYLKIARKKAIERLGSNWLLHPNNAVKKK
jgi:hypothetical protein